MVLVQEDGRAAHFQSELLDALFVVHRQQEGLAALLRLHCSQDGKVLRERITWQVGRRVGQREGEKCFGKLKVAATIRHDYSFLSPECCNRIIILGHRALWSRGGVSEVLSLLLMGEKKKKRYKNRQR